MNMNVTCIIPDRDDNASTWLDFYNHTIHCKNATAVFTELEFLPAVNLVLDVITAVVLQVL